MPEKTEEIAEILKAVRDGAPTEKVVMVVGDGIAPRPAIKPRPTYLEYARSTGKLINGVLDEDRICWRYYETERWTSGNVYPERTHYYAWRLCYENLVHCVVTNNYDLQFESMFHKDPLPQGTILNPVASDSEYRYEGFYGQKSQINDKVQLFKIHGSLGFASFMQSNHPEPLIFKLPHFLVGFPKKNPTDDFALSAHDYLGHEMAVAGVVHPSLKSDRCERLGHFIDFNFPRSVFSRLINGAYETLNSPDVKLVLVVGFTGYYDPANAADPFNEELVPVLLNIADRVPVFYLLNSSQNPARSYLYAQLPNKAKGHVFQDSVRPALVDIVRNLSQLITGNETLSKEWGYYYQDNWVSGYLFAGPP